MTVWTFYNHGTDGSSLKSPDKGEIVNLFGNNDLGLEFQEKLITEGVGGIGDPYRTVYETRTPGNGGGQYVWKENSLLKWPSLLEKAFGIGVSANVKNALAFVSMLQANGRLPTAINMLGWSRGAVTSIRIAYFLYLTNNPAIQAIPVNIFAVDPVAGAGHNHEVDATTLTPNVRNYLATLATTEYRRAFRPIAGHRLHIVNPARTRVWVLPMPGTHSDTAKMNNDTGELVFNLAYRFLHANRSRVDRMRHYQMSKYDAWRAYERIMTNPGAVHKTSTMGAAPYGLPYRREREILAHRGAENFFPNVHARKIFQRQFPQTYDAYFDAGSLTIGSYLWGAIYGARTALEKLLMAPAFLQQLEAIQPGPPLPPVQGPGVDNMISAFGLID